MPGYRYSVKFFLQKSEPKNVQTQLRCYIRYNSKLVIVGTGINIKPVDWNADKNEPRQKATLLNADKLKSDLEDIKKWVSDAFDHLTEKNKSYPNEAELKELCKYIIKSSGLLPGQTKDKPKITLTWYINKLIDDTKSGKRSKSNGGKFTPDTIKHYNSAYGVINRYAQHIGKPVLQFSDIDMDFYYGFKDYAYNLEIPLSDNYFGTIIKFLKTCMNEAAEEGLHTNAIHNNKRFVKVQADVDNVYLNIDQLQKIIDADLKGDSKLDRVRDLFIVGCWTGLRFSDFTNIKPENIEGNLIQIKAQKTGELIAIPVHENVKNVMAKYTDKTFNNLPPAISNAKMNEYLKDLGKKSGLSEIKVLEKAQGGKIVKVEKPLHDLITTHTARRSFASNMFRMGVPAMVIMGVTGHKTETSFMKYIKVSPREKAQIMQEVWARQTMKAV